MKLYYTSLFVICALRLFGQSGITKIFEMSPSQYDLGTAILPDGDGYAVFGYKTDLDNTAQSKADIFLLRLDAEGNETARFFYGAPNASEYLKGGVVPVGNNGWLLAGWQISNTGTSGYLLRVGANGTVLWSKNIANTGYLSALKAVPSGGYIVLDGSTSQVIALRISEDGDVIWKKGLGTDGPSYGLYVSEGGGNCFVTTRDKVVKIRTSDGNVQWKKTIELPDFGATTGYVSVDLSNIKPVGNGSFVISGTALNDEIFSFTTMPYASLWKENGDIQWVGVYPEATYPESGSISNNSLLFLPNERELMLAGESNEGFAITRIDLKGNVLSGSKIPSLGINIYPVLAKYQGKYCLTGGNLQSGMNTFFFRSESNWLPGNDIQRPDARSVDAVETTSEHLFPNPVCTYLQVEWQSAQAGEHMFRITDAMGRVEATFSREIVSGYNSLAFDVQALAAGRHWLLGPGWAKVWVKE